VLIGLIQEGNGVASTVLENLGVKLDKVEKEIMLLVKEAGAPYQPEAQLPFTPRTKQSLEHACEEAKTLDHKYIGTEHILLGLLKEGEGLAAQVLLNLGLTLEKVRKETMEFLGAVPVSKKKVEGKATGHEVEGE
jgi:ATP-dependent Clp protease ATP-binding subunit ClpC